MGQHEWLFPTFERLAGILRYPDLANEYHSSKVTAAAARTALLLLMKHMGPETPAPRIAPTTPGGLLLEWHEYWVDCTLIVEPSGIPKIRLYVLGAAQESEIAEGQLPSEAVLGKALFMIQTLLRDGPPPTLARPTAATAPAVENPNSGASTG